MSLTIRNHESLEELFEHAARDFLYLFESTLKNKTHFDVALSGGSTATAFFGFLINELIDHPELSRLRFFMSDERVVNIDSIESNAGNAKRLLLTPLGIDEKQLFPMYDEHSHPEACAKNYENLLKTLLVEDSTEVPIFDLIYLGMGSDGHTASLFPHDELLKDAHRLVRSTKGASFAYERITMMPRLINAASNIHVLVYGEQKAPILNEIVNGPLMHNALPAQLILRNEASNVMLFTAELTSIAD